MTESQTPENTTKPDVSKMHTVGTLIGGDEPRLQTFHTHWTTRIIGYVVTAVSQIFVREVVVELAHEDASKYEKASGSFLRDIGNGYKRLFDTKLWKSNLASAVTLVGGLSITEYVARKMERNNFRKHSGGSPRAIQEVNQILDGTFDKTAVSPSSTITNWQEKTQKSSAPEAGIGL